MESFDTKELRASEFTTNNVNKRRIYEKAEEVIAGKACLQARKVKLEKSKDMVRAIASSQVSEYREEHVDFKKQPKDKAKRYDELEQRYRALQHDFEIGEIHISELQHTEGEKWGRSRGLMRELTQVSKGCRSGIRAERPSRRFELPAVRGRECHHSLPRDMHS
jgi:hypothetical protein